jgi:hypothetical protein
VNIECPAPQSDAGQNRFAFADSWSRLNRHVELIPMGWQRLYSDLRFTLAVISTPKRCTIEIAGAWEEDGLLQVQSDTTDRVVQGVLRKARVRAMCTCMECGRPGKQRELDEWRQATLCGSCAGPRLLSLEIARLMALDRCGSVDLRHELQSSPSALLVRAAAEAGALACNLPPTFVLEKLGRDGQLRWLKELRHRAQQDSLA